MTFHLNRHEPLTDGLRRIATEQIGTALEHADDAGMPADRKVHSLRTRCKKMRGLLRLVRPLMCESFHVEDRRFRAAAKHLASARDSSVRAATIASLDAGGDDAGVSTSAVSSAALGEARQILAASLEAVDDWPLDLHGFVDIGPGFAQTYRKAVDAWQRVLAEPGDANYHRLRKWTKNHWYHVRILERVKKTVLRPRRRQLRKIQLELGDAHDLALLIARFGAGADPDAQLLERATMRKRKLYEKAVERGRVLFAVSADELVADFARWWLDWD